MIHKSGNDVFHWYIYSMYTRTVFQYQLRPHTIQFLSESSLLLRGPYSRIINVSTAATIVVYDVKTFMIRSQGTLRVSVFRIIQQMQTIFDYHNWIFDVIIQPYKWYNLYDRWKFNNGDWYRNCDENSQSSILFIPDTTETFLLSRYTHTDVSVKPFYNTFTGTDLGRVEVICVSIITLSLLWYVYPVYQYCCHCNL